jgi:SagB-type dehydrogenase family enzyme
MTLDRSAYQRTVAFHQATKHHPDRYARSPGYMDWANQPNPFRSYDGCETIPLPLLKTDPDTGHAALYTPSHTDPAPRTLAAVAGFLELSLGLSAWKAAGDNRWALRMNPSSGNLHPTEGHLALPAMDGFDAGIYHYDPLNHGLERRAHIPSRLWRNLAGHLGTGGFAVALTSIFWRESWKYGERAFRYCQHDLGHALAALTVSASLNGWRLTLLGNLGDDELAAVFGLDRTPWPPQGAEHPGLAAWVHPAANRTAARNLPGDLVESMGHLEVYGRPNRLSRAPVDWEIIGDIADATAKPRTDAPAAGPANDPPPPFVPSAASPMTAAAVIRQRRSATAFDPEGTMALATLETVLDKTLFRSNVPPFAAGVDAPAIDLVLFIHRVDGLAPGLYALDRMADARRPLKAALKNGFEWERASSRIPLFLLKPGDVRHTAINLSCQQPIAGFGIFSLAMVARFQDRIENAPYRYRHLFWEAGMIGQVLYLEAEAHGYRGTGIGCFFDDAVHDRIGIHTLARQILYHFTVGVPEEDARITTLPPYDHLER